MNKYITTFVLILIPLSLCLIGMGCELGINPLLFDGSPVTATFRAHTVGNTYSDSKSINLHDVVTNLDKDIDSIKVFNVTLQIDSLTNGTNSSTLTTGSVVIDTDTLFTVRNVALSAFASERSIFDNSLTGFSYNPAGVNHLISLLQQHPLPTNVTLTVAGTATNDTLYFRARIKLYTQVFTSP